MGGIGNKSIYANSPTKDKNDKSGISENMNSSPWSWFNDPENSNYEEWRDNLTEADIKGLKHYIGSGYEWMQNELYKKPWSEMSDSEKAYASKLYEALNKFELNQAITLRRRTDFQIFGAEQNSKMTVAQLKKLLGMNDTFQSNGFLSFTANLDYKVFSHNKGVVIDMVMPPNKGGGAWTGTYNSSEQEFIVNSNSVLKFDPTSVRREKDGLIHVNAEWLGQAKDQVFKKDPNGPKF